MASGQAIKVGGAEYFIDNDPGLGKAIPLNASDGTYDAVNGAWENVTAALNTNNLTIGTHIIYVREQWSATQTATLIIQP